MTAEWTLDAHCITAGPAVMLPDGMGPKATKQKLQAKAVCAHCRVKPECLDLAMALEGNSPAAARAGVWGGLDEDERAALALLFSSSDDESDDDAKERTARMYPALIAICAHDAETGERVYLRPRPRDQRCLHHPTARFGRLDR